MSIHRRVTWEDEQDEQQPVSSPFRRALAKYQRTRKKGAKLPQFLEDLEKADDAWTKTDVQNAIMKLERDNAGKKSVKVVRTILKPVIRVLNDYTAIVDSLAQADPMPTSVIWGCLRVAINASSRFLELYEKIPEQLESLQVHLANLTEYEELFSESSNMQILLEKSYVNVVRFWYRVEKECKRCILNRAARAFSSFSTSKIDKIVEDIEQDAHQISLFVPIVQERMNRGERENAAEERRLAGVAREQQNQMLELFLEERKGNRLKDVRQWLQCGLSPLNESSERHRQENTDRRSPETCIWLPSLETFEQWVEGTLNSKLWLRAAPGVGKSVLCSYAVDHVSKLKPDCCCVYHFYSFDEEFTPLQVYRNLAAQLVDRLWSQVQDIPEELYVFIQQSSSCSSVDNAKNVIRMITEKFPSVYVFLDGLDEECENDLRLKSVLEVIDFLGDLPRIRLWCSSQNRARLRTRMEDFALIEVDQYTNNEDIKLCLSRRISELGDLELDEGYKTLILEDLLTKADGCFLWVSLMLESIADAQTLSHVQQEIQGALPGGYEDYYRRKIDSIKPSDRKLACLLLSCIVFARRPLRLEELCDATAAAEAEDAALVDHTQKLFQSKILKICEPLIQVQAIEGARTLNSVCTLTHASVRRFLLKRPDVLGLKDSAAESEHYITEEIMANVCLKYLWQASYSKLLSRNGDTYCDVKGTDILNQQLLPYAAKYWDKHLDAIPGHRGWETCEDSKSLCNRVTRFIRSPQYITCIQTQSLFVGGQFQFWLSSGQEYLGPHIKRVFPFWLANQCHPSLAQDYAFFLGEWGDLLDRITSSNGLCPGEVDRIFWSALGPRHFLHHGTSRYDNFMLSKSFQAADNVPRRFYDSIDETGANMVVLRLENLREGDSELRFECQSWSLDNREPQCTHSQMLKISDSGWHLYEYPLRDRLRGRAVPVDLTEDLQYMRIGCKLLQRSSEGTYEALDINRSNRYIDDIASRGRYLAIAQRNSVAEKEVFAPNDNEDVNNNHDYAEFLAQKLEAFVRSKEPSTNSSDSTAQSDQSSQQAPSSQTSVSTPQQDEAPKTMNEEVADLESEEDSDLDVEDAMSDDGDKADSEDLALESSSESEVNSAEMSWSEGSTQAASDIDDEEEWNDWASRDGGLTDLSDSETPTEASSELEIESNSDETPPSDEGIDFGGGKFSLKYRDQLPESDSDTASSSGSGSDEVEDHYSNSYFSGSGSEDESGSENGQGGHLEDLLLGSNKPANGMAQRISIQVYDTQAKSRKSAPRFHFTNTKASSLFASPPVFHPSKPLLVWAIGNNEILFADVSSNSYFTRLISTTGFQSCQVFVKAHFSPDGKYLHFAALEASHGATEDDIKSGKAKVLLNLQVTTHRLSERKTTRSPPRLVFRTNVIIGKTNRIDVSNLPFFLTWRSKHLFLTQRSKKLNTIRIPLFAPAPDATAVPVCFTQQPLYLPRTALSRNVHFIPPDDDDEGEKSKKGKQTKVTVIIGSHSSMPAQNFIVPKTQVSPPIMARVDIERDLGGWQCKPNTDFDAGAEANKAAGRLQSRFEAFDLKEDCDIIPFLF